MASHYGLRTDIGRFHFFYGTSHSASVVHHPNAMGRCPVIRKEYHMQVSRRDFLKYCIGSAAALGLETSVIGSLEKALAAGGGPPIVWLAGANCTGCTVSLANLASSTAPVDVADLLLNTINLAYHPNLMGAAGIQAVSVLLKATQTTGGFILAIEGGIPTAFDGHTCMLWTQGGKEITAMQAVKDLAPRAKAVLCIGSCSSFGGIPAANPNPTQIKSVQELTGVKTINIPGCPTHPDWVVGTIAQLLAGSPPKLDAYGRPTPFFGPVVHGNCPRKSTDWAGTFGVAGRCLQGLGCKGTKAHGDCSTRQWNTKTNWCVGANAICLGCTESGFPDRFSPFYSAAGALPGDHDPVTGQCLDCHRNLPDD
jgi:hydrogenase small subunit